MNTSNESTPLVIVKMIVSVLVAIIPFFVTWHKCKLESKAADAEHPHRQQSQAVGNIQSIQSNIQINQSIEDNRNQELLAQNEIENQQHESNEMKSGRVFGIAVLIVFAISAIYLISSPANYKINLNPSAFEFNINYSKIMQKIFPYICWMIVISSISIFINEIKWRAYSARYIILQISLLVIAVLYIVKFQEYLDALKYLMISNFMSFPLIFSIISVVVFFGFSSVNAFSNLISTKHIVYVIMAVAGNIVMLFLTLANVWSNILLQVQSL